MTRARGSLLSQVGATLEALWWWLWVQDRPEEVFRIGSRLTSLARLWLCAASEVAPPWQPPSRRGLRLRKEKRKRLAGAGHAKGNAWIGILGENISSLDIAALQKITCRSLSQDKNAGMMESMSWSL